MNKRQKETLEASLKDEAKVLKQLETDYRVALEKIKAKIKELDKQIKLKEKALQIITDPQLRAGKQSEIRSQIYQKNYQDSLRKQVSSILDSIGNNQYGTVKDYIEDCYEKGYVGVMYDLHGQGIPIITPINQKQVVQAIRNETKLSKNLYQALGYNLANLKKQVVQEITRGFASSLSWFDIARNIKNRSQMAINKAYRIARTEGHRIQNKAALDAQHQAKSKGAEIVKQWDSTLDGLTRPNHRKLDGQLREVDEAFEVSGHKALIPGGFGRAEEDINCRCAILQRARWALDEDELKTLQERAAQLGLDKSQDFADFKAKYFKAVNKEPTKPKFNPVKTVAEAKKALIEQIGFAMIESSFEQIADQLIISNTNQLMILEQKFGAVRKSEKPTITSLDLDRGTSAYVRSRMTNPLEQNLSLCPSSYRNLQRLIKSVRNNIEKGWTMPAALTEAELQIYTVTHEYGHMLQNTLLYEAMQQYGFDKLKAKIRSNAKTKKALLKPYEEFIKQTAKEHFNEIIAIAKKNNPEFSLIKNISDYGRTNTSEFFAEVFANSQLSKPNELGKAMNIWLEQRGLIRGA